MRIKKLYFSRTYNQWKGEPLFVEDGLENSCLYVRMLDVNFDEGSVNVVTAEFKDLNGYVHPVLAECDYAKKLAIFQIPLAILSNNGIYEVGFSISYNSKDKEGGYIKSAIQTFEIIDAIEVDNEAIIQDANYSILTALINQLAGYKVDTSIFPTREEMNKAIEDNVNKLSLKEVLNEVANNGYITLEKLNIILKNYITKFDSSGFAKQSDLNRYVTNIKYIQDLERYALKTSLNNFVVKESGKGLSTHDLTDALYKKLVDIDLNDIKVDLTGYATEKFVIDKILETQLKDIDLTIYAKKDELPKKLSDLINDMNYLTEIPSEYITESRLPKKLSELENDEGYIKEHQSLEEYARKTDLHNHSNKVVLDSITQEKINAWDTGANIDLSGYAEKTELHQHSNKTVLDSITQDNIDSWNAKTNEAINNELDEVNANITAVADDLDSMDGRVLYLEKQENKAPILSFNDNGDLVVTINGVSKIFTPKE